MEKNPVNHQMFGDMLSASYKECFTKLKCSHGDLFRGQVLINDLELFKVATYWNKPNIVAAHLDFLLTLLWGNDINLRNPDPALLKSFVMVTCAGFEFKTKDGMNILNGLTDHNAVVYKKLERYIHALEYTEAEEEEEADRDDEDEDSEEEEEDDDDSDYAEDTCDDATDSEAEEDESDSDTCDDETEEDESDSKNEDSIVSDSEPIEYDHDEIQPEEVVRKRRRRLVKRF
jgi:hypothetical protein